MPQFDQVILVSIQQIVLLVIAGAAFYIAKFLQPIEQVSKKLDFLKHYIESVNLLKATVPQKNHRAVEYDLAERAAQIPDMLKIAEMKEKKIEAGYSRGLLLVFPLVFYSPLLYGTLGLDNLCVQWFFIVVLFVIISIPLYFGTKEINYTSEDIWNLDVTIWRFRILRNVPTVLAGILYTLYSFFFLFMLSIAIVIIEQRSAALDFLQSDFCRLSDNMTETPQLQ